MSIYSKLYTLFHIWYTDKEDEKSEFFSWLKNQLRYYQGALTHLNQTNSSFDTSNYGSITKKLKNFADIFHRDKYVKKTAWYNWLDNFIKTPDSQLFKYVIRPETSNYWSGYAPTGINVNVKTLDYNNQLVEGADAAVYASKGTFNNASNTDGNIYTESDGDGEINAVYNLSDYGLIGLETIRKYSVDTVFCNKSTGWVSLTFTSNWSTSTAKYCCNNNRVYIRGQFTATKEDTTTKSSVNRVHVATIPVEYAPSTYVHRLIHGSNYYSCQLLIHPDGKIYLSRHGGLSTGSSGLLSINASSWIVAELFYFLD